MVSMSEFLSLRFVTSILPAFFIILVSCKPALAQINLENGLVGCYPFSGNANDLSERQNHGIVNGAALAADRFGNPNSAYSFDGIDDYIEIDPADLQGNTFSYSLWLYPRKAPGDNQAFFIISVGSTNGDQHMMLAWNYARGVMNGLGHSSYMGYDFNVRCMTGQIPALSQWYHLVLVKDPTTYYYYINGKLICTNPTNGSSAYYGIGSVRAAIGARNNFAGNIDASIDDIHLYNRPLNASEVQALYTGTRDTPVGNATITSSEAAPCAGADVSFTAKTDGMPAIYNWKIDGLLKTSGPDPDFAFKWPEQSGTYQSKVSVDITYENSCFQTKPVSAETTVTIKNCQSPVDGERLIIPSAFTPNRDGKNDKWQFFNTESLPQLSVMVYNRWGEVIFHSNDYQTPWEGTYQDETVAPGPYPYKVLSEGKLIRQGVVTILH